MNPSKLRVIAFVNFRITLPSQYTACVLYNASSALWAGALEISIIIIILRAKARLSMHSRTAR